EIVQSAVAVALRDAGRVQPRPADGGPAADARPRLPAAIHGVEQPALAAADLAGSGFHRVHPGSVLRKAFFDHDAPPPRPLQVTFQVFEARLPARRRLALVASVCRAGVRHVLRDRHQTAAFALGEGQLQADARERLADPRLVRDVGHDEAAAALEL